MMSCAEFQHSTSGIRHVSAAHCVSGLRTPQKNSRHLRGIAAFTFH
jgi:hypothetical protein